MKFCLHVHFFDQAQINAPPKQNLAARPFLLPTRKYGHKEGQMAPREAREVTLLRKSDALNSAAKIFGLKVDAFVLYGIFLSLDPKKTQ